MKEQNSDLSDLEKALDTVSTTNDIELIQQTVDTYGAKPWYRKYGIGTGPESRTRQEISRVGVTRWAELTDQVAEVLTLAVGDGYAIKEMMLEYAKKEAPTSPHQALRNVINTEGNRLFGDKFNPNIAKEAYDITLRYTFPTMH